MPGAGHPARGKHQSQRMHSVPALPDAVPPRPAVSGDDPAPAEAREIPRFRPAATAAAARAEAADPGARGVTVPRIPGAMRRPPEEKHMTDETRQDGTNLRRRGLLSGTATAALAGLAAGGTAVSREALAQARSAASSAEVKPGDLDEYYGFSSSGQTGEVRIIGLPSSRELMRIPVFNRCSATGWGLTNESKKILTEGMLPETRKFLETRSRAGAAADMLDYCNGDAHHPHMSFTNGTYDGRYLWINDKANCRIARIRC